MTSHRVPTKATGLHIERTGDELLVYDPRDDRVHSLSDVTAAVFEACNGVRTTEEAVEVVTNWSDTPVESDLVDRAVLDLTHDNLIVIDIR